MSIFSKPVLPIGLLLDIEQATMVCQAAVDFLSKVTSQGAISVHRFCKSLMQSYEESTAHHRSFRQASPTGLFTPPTEFRSVKVNYLLIAEEGLQ
jgi:hypothetical protein